MQVRGGQTPSKEKPIEGTHVLAEIQAKEAETAAGCPFTCGYWTTLQERGVQTGNQVYPS